jgi:hypothetical protein
MATFVSRIMKRKLPEEEVQLIIPALRAIKQKDVEEMRKLSQIALDALVAME